ncbi:MAG: hypothetical protein ACFFBP_16570 [Promethearchaeota archaeon]
MHKTTYVYDKPEFGLKLNLMPIWFKEIETSGDINAGSIILESQNIFDEFWGPIARMELNWENKDVNDFYHPREVQKNIDVYSGIQVAVTKKKNDWINSHNYTIWYGHRRKLIKTSYYEELSIHGIFYCDQSNKIYDLNAGVIKEHYEGFEPYILDAFNSIVCH